MCVAGALLCQTIRTMRCRNTISNSSRGTAAHRCANEHARELPAIPRAKFMALFANGAGGARDGEGEARYSRGMRLDGLSRGLRCGLFHVVQSLDSAHSS